MSIWSRPEDAALYSRAAHQATGQRRKYTGEPYYLHPQSVAAIVREHGGTEEMIAAAYLHDVVEDTAATIEEIVDVFGGPIANLVWQLTDRYTDPALGNRAARKAMERERLARIFPEAQTIKYADLIDNTGSIVARDPAFARVYLAEKRELLCVMDQGDQRLWRKAWGLMVEGEVALEEKRQGGGS